MNQFVFEARQKTGLIVMMAIGVLCMLLTFVGGDAHHTRFWSNFLHNSVFFTGIAIMAFFFLVACITAWAGWTSVFKRIWEAYSLFLIVGLLLILIVAGGVWGDWHHLYHWADAESVANDKILKGKASFLNPAWFTFATIAIMGLWIWILSNIRKLSLQEDKDGDASFRHHHKMRIWAAAGLPLVGFGSAALIWQWVMSVDAHWYSTLFAWYNGASWFVAMIALTIMTIYYLKAKGYYQQVTNEHLHDLGKYMFAISIFWTYLWFSQYMLIWYANVGEETTYFKTRLDEYPVLFYGNLLINFFLPFLVLLRNDTKRKAGSMIFTSVAVFIGHWLDFFLMIKPGVMHTAHEMAGHGHGAEHAADHAHALSSAGFTIPGFLEFGTMIGFLGLFLFFVLSRMSKASLVPEKDPYLAESLHHHV